MENLQDIMIRIRKDLKLSLREAANLIGISHSYLSTLEKGFDPRTGSPIKPTPETLKLISEAYGIKYEKLMIAAGYLNKYSNITAETFDDEDFNEIAALIIEHLNERIMKNDDKKSKIITDALDLNRAWEHLDSNEKAKIFNLIIKDVVHDKATGNVSVAQYFDPGPNSFQMLKKEFLNFLQNNSNIENSYQENNKEKYEDVHDIEEAMKIILEQPGLMLKGSILSDESKIILANAIQMGLRTAEEIEDKKNKGDSND